jgi:fluoride ion exporter CrcB/FEX
MTLIRKKGIIEMANFIGLGGLVMNLIASLMIGYVRIFRSKKTIKKKLFYIRVAKL